MVNKNKLQNWLMKTFAEGFDMDNPEHVRQLLSGSAPCASRGATNGGIERHAMSGSPLCPKCYAGLRYLRGLDPESRPAHLEGLQFATEDDMIDHFTHGMLLSFGQKTPVDYGHGSSEGAAIHQLENTPLCVDCAHYEHIRNVVKRAFLGTPDEPYNPLTRVEVEVEKSSDPHSHPHASEGVFRTEGGKKLYTTDVPARVARLYVPKKLAENVGSGSKCDHCGRSLLTLGLYIAHVHHINPLYNGERITNLDDLKVVHPQCHRDIHIEMEDRKAVERAQGHELE